MGVPHLITYLRPFGKSVDLAGHTAVIDGPSLAYHVWHICLSSRAAQQFRNPFEATPTYKLLGETVIRWLDELQARNVCLKKIFFDGSLPVSKRPIRIGRITGYTKQLNDYNQAWPQMIPSFYIDSVPHLPYVKLFNIEALPCSFTKLPAAPFLVPAIIEALSHCDHYADLVEVVPGEADSYCADYIKTHGGVVITGDSDLLIHELGDGAVCFFKDIDFPASPNKPSLTCVQYQVGAIVQRLGLAEPHGLLALAFEMAMDAHASFKELLQKAVKLNAISTHGALYQHFANEYKALQSSMNLQETRTNESAIHFPSLNGQLKMLDPRVSEYILQFPEFSQAASSPRPPASASVARQDHIDVFLPFLLDCPLRTSAWEMSTSVRQLAYGLVNLVLPQEEEVYLVTEYRRLQNGSRGREWQVPAAQQLPKACSDLHELFNKLRNGISLLAKQDIWRAFAIYQDQELHLSAGKPGLSSTLIKPSGSGKASSFRLTWDRIHLFAQFQGSYYSFRILKQIISIVLLYDDSKTLPLALHQLHVDLESLPALEKFQPAMDIMRNIGGPDDQATLVMVENLLGIELEHVLVKGLKKKGNKILEVSESLEGLKHQQETDGRRALKHPGKAKRRKKPKRQQKEPNNIFEQLYIE